MNWWQRLFRRNRLERELDAEVRYHFERLVADNLQRGMSEQEACRRARLEFGGSDQVEEMCRDARGTRWAEETARDVRFTVRLLSKERWFTATAIVALALGLGVASVVVTIIDGYYFRGLPVHEPDRILSLGTRDVTGRDAGLSYRDYRDWRALSRSFTELGAFVRTTMTVSDRGEAPDSFRGAYISATAFHILGEKPILGRGLSAADDRPGAPPVVVLGHRLWASRYGRDPSVIGRMLLVNRVPATVVGVLRQGFEFPFRETLWQPLLLMPGIEAQSRDVRTLSVFGRLVDGISPAGARAELAALAAALAKEHPETNSAIQPTAARFAEHQVGRFADAEPPQAVAVMAAFVLLIACANVANLLLARSASRSREMAIRASIGATRWRIVRQLLVESVVLAFPAGALGLWLSRFGVRFISDAFGQNIPYWMEFSVDGHVVLTLMALCLLASLLLGLAPALSVSRANVSGVMKEGGRTSIAPRVRRWTQALLVAEVALTLILLAGAGLMVRSFVALYRADRVVDASRVLTGQLSLPESKYPTPERRSAFYRRLDAQLGAAPGIALATVASTRPFVGGASRQLSLVGRSTAGAGKLPSVSTIAVGPRYFAALRLGLLRGRAFTDRDGTPGREVAIVNRRFAEVYYPNEDVLGRRIQLLDDTTNSATSLTIIGMSPTVRQGVASAPRPVVYVPLSSCRSAEAALIVGGLLDPPAVAPLLRQEIASLDADVTLFNVRPLEDLLADSRLQHRLVGTLLPVFAGIGLFLSMIGLYAVTAYAVLQRTHEIGVRIALGARSGQVVWLFVRRGLTPLVIGLLIGLAGALAVGRVLRGALIQTSPTDPVTLVAIVSLLVTVAIAAYVFPARRAARLDPLVVLRNE